MSNQAIFNAALKHIREQGKQSIDFGGCVYLNSEGLKCAFGPCIEDYTSDIEGKLACEIYVRYRQILYDWARDADRKLARDIQLCHDIYKGTEFLKHFEIKMQKVAEEWNLDYETRSN